MTDIKQIWRAGRVRRWHMNPEMSDTNDYNDGHSARVARILIALFPSASFDLVKAALTHDDEELFCGDVSGPVKYEQPEAYKTLKAFGRIGARAMWGGHLPNDVLTDKERNQLHFCDKLDAAMWVCHTKRWVLLGDGWPVALEWLADRANEFGIYDRIFDNWGNLK